VGLGSSSERSEAGACELRVDTAISFISYVMCVLGMYSEITRGVYYYGGFTNPYLISAGG